MSDQVDPELELIRVIASMNEPDDAEMVAAADAFDYPSELDRAVASITTEAVSGQVRAVSGGSQGTSDRHCARQLDFGHKTSSAIRQEAEELKRKLGETTKRLKAEEAEERRRAAEVAKREAGKKRKLEEQQREAAKKRKTDEEEKERSMKQELLRRKRSEKTRGGASGGAKPVLVPIKQTVKTTEKSDVGRASGGSKSGKSSNAGNSKENEQSSSGGNHRVAHAPTAVIEAGRQAADERIAKAAAAAEERRLITDTRHRSDFHLLQNNTQALLLGVGSDFVTLLLLTHARHSLITLASDDDKLLSELDQVVDRLSRPKIVQYFLEEMQVAKALGTQLKDYVSVFKRGCPVTNIQATWQHCKRQVLEAVRQKLREEINKR